MSLQNVYCKNLSLEFFRTSHSQQKICKEHLKQFLPNTDKVKRCSLNVNMYVYILYVYICIYKSSVNYFNVTGSSAEMEKMEVKNRNKRCSEERRYFSICNV